MAIADFFTSWREQERHANETNSAAYRRLIGKLADGGKLTEADGVKLRNAADALGKSYEQAEADADVIRKGAELRAMASGMADARRAHAEANHALQVFDADTKQITNDRAAQRLQVRDVLTRAGFALSAAQDADGELARLRGQHGALIGYADPNAAHRDFFQTAIRSPSGESPPPDLCVNTGGEPVVLSAEDFAREVARRRQYVEACRAVVDREYRQAVAGWDAFVASLNGQEQQNADQFGHKPQPKPAPTWDFLRRRFGRTTPPLDEAVKIIEGMYPPAPERSDFDAQPARRGIHGTGMSDAPQAVFSVQGHKGVH